MVPKVNDQARGRLVPVTRRATDKKRGRGRPYVFSAPTSIAAGARDLSRRNVSTAQTRPQYSKASLAYQHPLRTEVEWHLDKPGSAGVLAGELGENCGKVPARRRRSQAEHACLSAIRLKSA